MRKLLTLMIFTAGLGLTAGLSGCISALPPSLDVVGAQVVEQTAEGARLEVNLVMSNPNDVALPLPETNYTVSVAGVGSYSAVDLPALVLGPKGTQSFTLPAAIATDGQSLVGKTWKASGTVTYNPDNGIRRFLTETGTPLPVAFINGEGTLE